MKWWLRLRKVLGGRGALLRVPAYESHTEVTKVRGGREGFFEDKLNINDGIGFPSIRNAL
jgi:hypothetical protein